LATPTTLTDPCSPFQESNQLLPDKTTPTTLTDPCSPFQESNQLLPDRTTLFRNQTTPFPTFAALFSMFQARYIIKQPAQ